MREYLKWKQEQDRIEAEERREKWDKFFAVVLGFAVCLIAALAITGVG